MWLSRDGWDHPDEKNFANFYHPPSITPDQWLLARCNVPSMTMFSRFSRETGSYKHIPTFNFDQPLAIASCNML